MAVKMSAVRLQQPLPSINHLDKVPNKAMMTGFTQLKPQFVTQLGLLYQKFYLIYLTCMNINQPLQYILKLCLLAIIVNSP
ncbi:hypothetical protein [Nostoc sp. LPT]|uniref:hypothetical protein n=1 Tax=Nostoc sp. LPT TaxID=2815387 RepID=UPI001DF8FF42|nr:hypothetical protein [Nostoc sp. LPT]MBN4005418.1 hypothetical protein [Nostoc sp. LPT]